VARHTRSYDRHQDFEHPDHPRELPIDKKGADLLFQVISQRYEHGSIILTTNKPFKKWPEIFNNDNTLTSAVLDRLLHHAHTITIEGPSYRMKDQIQR
jgi:DNA replication protein DnaC